MQSTAGLYSNAQRSNEMTLAIYDNVHRNTTQTADTDTLHTHMIVGGKQK